MASKSLARPLRRSRLGATLSIVALVAAGIATDAGAAERRVVHPNAEGGVTATTVHAHEGASGAAIRGRSVRTDGQGDATVSTGGAFRGVGGAAGARAGQTTINSDGSGTHRSGFSVQSAKGSAQSSGSASRDAAGNLTQSRTTTATSASTGNSFQSSTSYSSATGATHSASCYDSSGAPIACPKRP